MKFHPELTDGQISKLVGTTKPTIQSIRERTHWNISNIQPVDPVALGLTKQSELDAAVQKATPKKAKEGGVMSDDERRKLVSTEQSLGMGTEPRIPTAISGLETFSLSDSDDDDEDDGRDDLTPTAFSTCPTTTRMTTTTTRRIRHPSAARRPRPWIAGVFRAETAPVQIDFCAPAGRR